MHGNRFRVGNRKAPRSLLQVIAIVIAFEAEIFEPDIPLVHRIEIQICLSRKNSLLRILVIIIIVVTVLSLSICDR